MAQPLPSLIALRAFEATARHRSMTRAAGELCVTHGAVSRHVKALEATLGVSLLLRGKAPSELTPEGAFLAEGLSTAFGLVQATVERVRPGPLTLSCSASIMLCWLIPRLSAFHQAYADIQIELNTNYDKVDFSRDKIGLAIRNSTSTPPRNAVIRELGREWIGPVCSPNYLRSMRLAAPADLTRADVLATRTRLSGWRDWLAASGHPRLALPPTRSFEHFYIMIQAAACGLGVAVVPHMLVLSEIQSGRLIAPFGFLPGERMLMLWIASHLAHRSDLRILENWLVEEMELIPPPDVPRRRKVSATSR